MQAGAYVVMACNLCREEDVPERYRDIVMRCDGGSMIIGPDGKILAGPLSGSEGILTVKANLENIAFPKLIADNAGHYSRPDVFDFRVNRASKQPAVFWRRCSTGHEAFGGEPGSDARAARPAHEEPFGKAGES
jgi:hypothetical protein